VKGKNNYDPQVTEQIGQLAEFYRRTKDGKLVQCLTAEEVYFLVKPYKDACYQYKEELEKLKEKYEENINSR